MIHISGLTKSYDAHTKAVDHLELEVNNGEIFALLGPNGAGKSTTIRILTTLSGFDEGRVEVAGYDIDREPDKVRRAIGYVAQDTGVDFFLTGRENLTLQGHLYRMKSAEIKQRIEELAQYFELNDSLDKTVAEYSGGMRRKLDIATALIHHPKVLFLDEPTLGLDTQSRRSLWQYIRKINDELGLTILLTTHYLEEADKLANRVAIINQGQIKVVDTPDTLKQAIGGDVVSLEFEEEATENETLSWKLKNSDFIKDTTWEGNKLHLYVTNGAQAIPKIMEMAAQEGAKISHISFARPTLDDVFIKYTGSSLTGDNEEGGEQWWEKWAGKGGGGGKWAKKWQQNADNDAADQEQTKDQQGDWQRWQQQGTSGNTDEQQQQDWAASKDSDQDGQQWSQDKDSGEPASSPEETREQQATSWPNKDDDQQQDWQRWQQSGDDTSQGEWPKSQNGSSNDDKGKGGKS